MVEKAVLTSILLKFLKVSFSLVKYTSQTDKEFFDEIELFFAVAILSLATEIARIVSASFGQSVDARRGNTSGLGAGHDRAETRL